MASLASLRPPWRSPKAIHVIWRIALFRACAEEIRGSSSNPATFKDAKMSSSVFLEGAVTTADKAVDGDTGGHLYFSAGCAITDWQAEPWWRVDLGTLIPMAVVRIYPRTDNPTFTKTGLQMRVGMKDQWDGNPACASDIALQTVGVTAVNCFAGGRFVFIGAPNTESARLAICEIDVVIRGPKEVKQYMGAIGRPVDIRVDGVGMLPEDRIRIIKPSILCGSATADSMDSALVERTRPYGAPEVESSEVERWLDVEFLKMGFYKICWCSGMFSCVNGADFTFLIGFAVITGEMRTVAGNGTEPVRNVDEWEDLYTVRVGSVNGMALSADGLTLYWAEPHRVREANLVNGSVRTLVGDLQAGNCVAPGFVCGDGLPGTSARLNDPRGLAVCRGELLIADHMNSRIRAYNFETGIITTKVGTDHGYSGDGGAPNLAKLSGPTGVVCDDLRGYWIADTGNSAIRGVRVSPGQSDVISTVVGGLGQGLATPGTWSNQAQLDHPMQLAMSERWGAPRSLTYVENYNAVARFLPLGSSVMEGAVQQVIGTGSTGHTTTANKQNIMMNRPEGIAVHSSTVFVSDTMNHRIIMVPILEYEPLGCYKEVTIEGESTLIPSLEGDLEAGLVPAQVCRDEVLDVADAVARCARATIRKGWEVFAVRCGGVCASAIDADNWYRFNGWSTLCEKGRGGLTANSVYRIIKEHAKDLIGNFYIIAGQALTTETGEAAEKPRAGFFGDRLASWLTAMDEPSQMAASEITRNLFFGDRGNKRVRVIFGSLGPQPQTQQFYCTNGLECVLNVNGNGFSEKDHIAFSRDYFTSAVVCGQDRLEDQFPQVHNLAEWSRLFLNKNFNLGRISLPAVGQFIVCYCIGNVGKECDVTQDFEFKAGRLHVVGPNARSTFYALAGVPFDLALFGSAFRTTDRIRLIRLNETCGAGGSTSVDDMLPFIRVAGNASLKAGIGPWDEGSETYQVWLDLSIDEAAELKVCWCNEAPCPFDSFFQVEAMYLSVRGPEQKSQVVEYGQPFDLLMEGPSGFKAADRVRLQDATVPCNAPQRRADLEDALPLDATPCEVSATSVRWCGVKLPLSAPSSLVACWCGALGGFNATNYTGVPAVWLSVNGQGQGAAGPVYRRELPPPPLSDSGWPSYINKGAYNISVQMYGRNAPGAASPGPLHVTICEMPDRCLLPLELRELSAGGAVTAEAERTWSGTTLFPKAVKVTSLSADPYLADFVDVELSGQWRRFPLNRWLLTQDGYTENVWESFTPPPLPTAAPTETLYTEGDRCGGCGLGMICRERPQTALELAKQGISLATATTVYMVWDCQFACGDGLVIGEEECDDGGLDAFDGCDANCKVEPGFVCSGATGTAPSQCRPVGCGALPHPSPVAACEDAESSPAAVTCRSNDELGACGSLSPPSLFAACPGQATQRCEATISRPQAVLAQLVHGGSALMLAFDTTLAELDGLSYGTELNCSNVFSPTTVAELGDEALCLQGSPRHIVVRLGFGASLGTASTAVFVLDAARQYQQIDVPIEVSRPFEFPSQRLFLGPALGETWNFQQPQVVLRGPSIWGQCGDLHLDGSFSLGSGGRPWKLIRWRCSGDGSHCAKIISYLPNSCNQLTLGLDTAGLAVGSVPCGLRATIPESVAIELTMALANLNVYLKLENVLGQWDEAMHGISFTTSRVPDAVALTSRQVLVDQGSSIRLELSVGPALPVASLGAGSSCGALGPVSLEWRYGAGTVADASQAWSEMSSTPASLIATLDAKTALLEGFLGSMDVPGSNWTLVARVFHTAGGESVYVPFFLAVRPQPPSISLDAPTQISDQCSFSVVASSSGVSGDPYITWRCVLMDVVAANNQEASLCAARALQERGSVLSLPALIPGVYQIEAILDDPLKPMDTIFVHVATGAGPRVQILEPALPLRRSGGDDVRFKARLLATSCGTSAMAAAVVVFSSVPGEGAEDPSARPELVLSTTVMNISQDVQPDDNFEAVIPLASLALGLSHSFHLLLAEGIQARQAMQQYTSNLSPLVPSSMEVPAEVWAYRSAPVTRCLLPAAELFVEPATGFSSRTLFTLRARALCEGCMYSFRLATRSMVDPNATDSPTDCSRATTTWQDLRTWSSDPEAKLPLLQGNYVLEVRVRSLDGGTSQACNMVDVTDSNLDPTFQGVTPEQADALIKTWTSDASRSIATLRALQQPTLLVQSLDSISKEFPRTETLAPSTADSSGQAMRQLYSEFCEGATDAVDGLPASEFLSSRRLSQGTPMLTSAMQSLLACMDGLFPLLTLPELWQTLQVLDAVLDRNAQLRGILGPGSSGRPLVSLPLLALCDLVLLKAYHIANSTSVITRSNTTALVDRIMATTLGIGNVAASTSTFDAAPIQVFNPGRALVLSTKSFQSYTLRTSGLTLDHTTQTFQDLPYPGLSVPAIPDAPYSELTQNVTTLSGPPLCLGDATLMGRLDLLIIQWGFNTIAVGQRVGSTAPADGVLISMRDIRLRSCGVDVPLFPAALESQEVEMLVELPEDVIQERRWGYGNISPFRCVRWVSSGFGRPGQWIADGCSNAYRGQDDPPVGDKAGLAEGVLRCRCTSLIPGTWAVEIVPRPPVIVEPPEVLNTSVKTLVAYAALIMWLPLLVPLLVWALMGDLILSLHGEEATKKLAEGLLPAALISGGVWGDAEKLLQNSPWPLRCSFSLHLVAFVIFLRSLCGAGRRQRWRDEAKDVSRYRNALCYARLKGSRVEPEAPLRAAEPQAAQASLPAQDPIIRERAPVAKWRKGPAALPASDQPAAAVKVPVAETQEQPKLLSHQPDPIGALLKQPDAFEEQQAKQAALHMTEYDWSEQVRGNVTSTGVQRSVLPEGWIMQNAGSQVYYVNLLDGKSTWERPTQPAMNVLSMQELRDLLGRAADGIALRKQLEEMLRPRIAERLAAMGDVAAQGQDRRFHHEAMHRAPAPEEENVAPPDSLRQAALVETSTGEFQASMSGVEGSLRLPLRFRALAWGFCTLLGACFLRSWPVTAALLPCLRPSRLERATKFAYRLNAALAFAAGALYLQPIADFSSIPEAVNADRPDAELWAELEITQPLAIALGCASVVVGRFLAALLPVFPAVKAKELDNFGARSNWWKRAWIKQRTTEGFALFLGIGAAFLAVLLSAVQPQPRGAVAMASFCWAALMELVILPILSSLMQALSIYCVARDCCCGPSTAFLARLPGLLRFPPKGSWTSRDVLFKHLEALNSETSPRHQTKR